MNVLLIHQVGSSRGSGAVIAMYRLHRGLQARGIDSTIACRRRDLEGQDVVEMPRADALERWLGRITWRLGLRDVHCVSSFKLASFAPFLEADVVNIHGWHTNFFSYLALPRLARRKPIVATLHDMWNFTGHCAYSLDCDRWKRGCGKCPHLDAFPPVPRDATALEWKLKDWVYGRSEMTVVVPSSWLEQCARQSMLARFPIRRIPNGVDTDVFRPRDPSPLRRELGIPAGRHALLFSAVSVANHVKGADLLLEALEQLPEPARSDSTVVLMGQNGAEFAKHCPLPTVDLGFITDEQAKAKVYASCDLLMLPSRNENLSLVLLEALASGLPAVAFAIGGNGDVVRPGCSGHLAAALDPRDFAAGIAHLLADPQRHRQYRRDCRRLAEAEFSLDRHVARYVEVYEEVSEGTKARRHEGTKGGTERETRAFATVQPGIDNS